MAHEKSHMTEQEPALFYTAASLHISNNKRNPLSCIFCEKPHKSKKVIWKKSDAVFSAWKLGHLARDCKSKINCHECSRPHHLAMCESRHDKNNIKKDTQDGVSSLTTQATTNAAV